MKEGKAENRDERIWFKKKIPLIQFNVRDIKSARISQLLSQVKKYSNVLIFFLESGVRVACNKSRDFHPEKGEKVSLSLFPHMLLFPSIISPPFPHVYDACFDLGRTESAIISSLTYGKNTEEGGGGKEDDWL